MKHLQPLTSSLIILFSIIPYVISSQLISSLRGSNFEGHVQQRKREQVDSNISLDNATFVADVLDGLISTDPNVQMCTPKTHALSQCLLKNPQGNPIECVMCFVDSINDPTKLITCETLEQSHWCKQLDLCRQQKCPLACTTEFIAGANCVLNQAHCTDYQCSASPAESVPPPVPSAPSPVANAPKELMNL